MRGILLRDSLRGVLFQTNLVQRSSVSQAELSSQEMTRSSVRAPRQGNVPASTRDMFQWEGNMAAC
jgi:hypothetical protein